MESHRPSCKLNVQSNCCELSLDAYLIRTERATDRERERKKLRCRREREAERGSRERIMAVCWFKENDTAVALCHSPRLIFLPPSLHMQIDALNFFSERLPFPRPPQSPPECCQLEVFQAQNAPGSPQNISNVLQPLGPPPRRRFPTKVLSHTRRLGVHATKVIRGCHRWSDTRCPGALHHLFLIFGFALSMFGTIWLPQILEMSVSMIPEPPMFFLIRCLLSKVDSRHRCIASQHALCEEKL